MYRHKIIVLSLMACFCLSACSSSYDDTSASVNVSEDYADWREQTHSSDAEPNYETVFPQESVNRLDIVIAEDDWDMALNDMESIYGEFGGGTGVVDDAEEKPSFIESQVFFNGTQWYNVGFRFKGHSSLSSSWSNGTLKLPFKLDFDEYEDDYSALENQRFYGFKQLTFSSNFEDDSFLHEKLASEVFSDMGVVAPVSAMYSIYVDYGEGPVYFGLYTGVEAIADTVIDENFDDSDGNLYEAEGDAANFSQDTSSLISESFEKKNNEEDADWSDVENLSSIINADTRISDPDVWKDNLESVFDTETFLTWLAVNTVIQNWDTYGTMTHNYYLYNDPASDQLTWIPWDNNESFSSGKKTPLSLTFNEVNSDWPLIRYMMDDEQYKEEYIENVHKIAAVLDADAFKDRVSDLHAMIEPYVTSEIDGYTLLKSAESFNASVNTILEHVASRVTLANDLDTSDSFAYDETIQVDVGPGNMNGGGPPRR